MTQEQRDLSVAATLAPLLNQPDGPESEATSWLHLRADGDWRVFKDTGLWPHLIVNPEGEIVASRFTVWGARRYIRRHKRRPPPVRWWQRPILYREDS